MSRRLRALLLCCLGATLALAAWGAPSAREVSAAGELYTLFQGAYGELFPEGAEAFAEDPVLALEISTPGQEPLRLLVPGTDDEHPETAPALIIADDDQSAFLAWEKRRHGLFSELYMVRYRAEAGWSEPFQLASNPFNFKATPRLAITRSTFDRLDENGVLVEHRRTTLHLLWWELTGARERVVYSPVVFLDGQDPQPNRLFVLDDLAPLQEGWSAGEAPAAILQSTWLAEGQDRYGLAAAFADAESGGFFTVGIRELPGELTELADKARAQITGFGYKYFPHDLPSLASEVRAAIPSFGLRFHPSVVGYLADRVADIVLAADPQTDSLEQLADKARAQITGFGAQTLEGGLMDDSELLDLDANAWLIEVESPLGGQLTELAFRSARPIPPLPPDVDAGSVRVFLSPKADDCLVAWLADGAVEYVASRGRGWSETRSLALREDLDAEAAFELLQRRIRRR